MSILPIIRGFTIYFYLLRLLALILRGLLISKLERPSVSFIKFGSCLQMLPFPKNPGRHWQALPLKKAWILQN